ncbi:HEPN domain-containing protein [uncultured Algibacter sp.]|uniref:HEPN domain-containing protein n=1 Tax=uncultured Algibacter sp. TaxID=298659 RepID=UPI002625F627|nr:HEPN domain-containing protein [uncultured Algibacter sp.]
MDDNINDEIGNDIPSSESDSQSEDTVRSSSEQAYSIFDSGIKRAQNLLEIDIDSSGNSLGISENKLLDSYRAVVVLSISALDSYIKTFLIVEIKKNLNERSLSSDLKKYIKEELFSKEELHQVVLENNFYDKVVQKFDADFEKRSFQGQKSIDKFMKLAGMNQIFKQISISADKSIDNILSSIENFTQRRHLIVHCGDHDLTQTELTEIDIDKDSASKCVELVKLIASEIHKISQEK